MSIFTLIKTGLLSRISRATGEDTQDVSLAGLIGTALGLIALMVGGVGAWAAYAPLSGAVIATGLVVVDSNVKKVQHPTGGVIGSLFVKNGDQVSAGDLVLRLDDTQTKANLGVVVSQLTQLIGRRARLEAERDDAAAIKFPLGFAESDPEAPPIIAGEKRLFEARQASKRLQKKQMKERVGQFQREIEGLTAQRNAKQVEIELMKEELARVEELRRKDLIPQPRVLQAQRDLVKLRGEWGALVAQIARAEGSISETELQIVGLDQTMQTDANKELRDIEARIAELVERRVAAEDQLKRIELRAPQSGKIHELAVHTVGGVISPGETTMLIVPHEEILAIEVRVAPNDIDQITIGQTTTVRFPAFNQRTTPDFAGQVSRIAADLTKEQQSGVVYYTVRIRLSEADAAKVSKLKLVPGMPVEAYVETGQRTVVSFLMKPLTDQIMRAFKED